MKKILMFLCIIGSIYSESNFDIGLKTINGKTSYTISGNDDGGWKSLLEFPLELNIIDLNYTYEKNDWDFKVNYQQNLQEGIGTFQDSDWIYSSKNGVAMYSQSDTISRYKSFSTEIVKNKEIKKSKNSYKYGIGYKEKRMNFDIYGANYPNTSSEIASKSLIYEVKYQIPYVTLQLLSDKEDKLSFKTNFMYSPYVIGQDEDIHLLRDKLSTSKGNGSYYEIEEEISYNINKNISLNLKGNYSLIKTNGKQKQEFYAGDYSGEIYENIDDNLKNEEYTISTSLSYKL